MLAKELSLPQENTHHTIDGFDQFLRLPENQNQLFELIHGKIVKKIPNEQHSVIAANVATALNSFARPRRLGRTGVEAEYKMPHDTENSRMPDVSFSTAKRPILREGRIPHMPDLAMEIKSPSNTISQLREKAQYYLANGSRLVWLIYPQHRMVEVYSPDEDVQILFGTDSLSGKEVLPGFMLPVADVFDDPLAE